MRHCCSHTHTHTYDMYMFVFFATRPCSQVNNLGHSLSQCLQIIMAFMTLVCIHLHLHMLLGALALPPLPASWWGCGCGCGCVWVCVCTSGSLACFGEFCSSSFYLRRTHTYSRAQPTKVHLDFYVVLVFLLRRLVEMQKKTHRAEH